jgi:nucleoside-diphosphate-sugar epimerase
VIGPLDNRPIVLITGATGNLGRSIGAALGDAYRIVGLDRKSKHVDFPVFEADITSDASVELALRKFRDALGSRIASCIHLVAYFDFTGEDNALYETVNVEGTSRLLRELQNFEVEQFVYASTMLVHAPCQPGERIDERHPIDPRWAYPKSKAAAEAVVRAERGTIPCVILRMAGVYDEHVTVPTMAHQMARIYERDVQSYFYSGSTLVGQAMLHRDDMVSAFRRVVDRRDVLPRQAEILIGEPDGIGYDALQDELGELMHGAGDWPTLRLPKAVAAAGAWVQGQLEPVIPDRIDAGKMPFIKPFMVAMADDHYALDIRRARDLLGWEPEHRLRDELPSMVANLKRDPAAWYKANGVTPPSWISEADDLGRNPATLRARHETQIKSEHGANRWAHFVNVGLATWLITQPLLIDVAEPLLRWSEVLLGVALLACATLALSWRASWARWACAGIGALVMAVPFLFSTANAAAYLSDTLVGALIFGFAVCTKPEPGSSALAALTGPVNPPGWSYNPSAWTQRLPIIALAIVGLYVSRYLAAYQLGHIPGVWDPFFAGSPADPRNGTEEIVTSWVSQAWPVSDAAVGGYTYLLEILTGIVGSRARWRTMPWLVVLFGLMIAARHHVDLLHHHPTGRHRHLEHHRADRRRGSPRPDPVLARRAARHAAVPAPARESRPELAARILRRRHRRNAQGRSGRSDRRRVRPSTAGRDQEHRGWRCQPAVEPGAGGSDRPRVAVHPRAARRRRHACEYPSRDRLAGADGRRHRGRRSGAAGSISQCLVRSGSRRRTLHDGCRFPDERRKRGSGERTHRAQHSPRRDPGTLRKLAASHRLAGFSIRNSKPQPKTAGDKTIASRRKGAALKKNPCLRENES